MGRYMPTECHHGTTIDWGDFGPHQDFHDCETDGDFGRTGCAVCNPICDWCENDDAIRWAAAVERMTAVRAGLDRDLRRASDEDALLFVLALPAVSVHQPKEAP